MMKNLVVVANFGATTTRGGSTTPILSATPTKNQIRLNVAAVRKLGINPQNDNFVGLIQAEIGGIQCKVLLVDFTGQQQPGFSKLVSPAKQTAGLTALTFNSSGSYAELGGIASRDNEEAVTTTTRQFEVGEPFVDVTEDGQLLTIASLVEAGLVKKTANGFAYTQNVPQLEVKAGDAVPTVGAVITFLKDEVKPVRGSSEEEEADDNEAE